jgi:hypothetical protein
MKELSIALDEYADYLMTKDDETLETLYIEYIVLAEDYV